MMEQTLSPLLERLESEAEQVEKAVSKIAELPGSEKTRRRATPREHAETRDSRMDGYRRARDAIRKFANSPEWRDHPVVLDLLDRTFELEIAIERDPTGEDPSWRLREIRDEIVDILATLRRELEHREIDDTAGAVGFLFLELAGVRQADLGELLGVDPRTLRSWRARRPIAVKRNPARVVLVAQLVYDLRHSMTPQGILQWFKRSRPQLDNRAPLEILELDVAEASETLRSLARGARGQLGT